MTGDLHGEKAKTRAREVREASEATCGSNEAWLKEMPDGGIASRWLGIPRRFRPLWLKLTRGEGTPRQAIKAQCLECQGYERAAVASCAATQCPLWRFRPGRSSRPTHQG